MRGQYINRFVAGRPSTTLYTSNDPVSVFPFTKKRAGTRWQHREVCGLSLYLFSSIMTQSAICLPFFPPYPTVPHTFRSLYICASLYTIILCVSSLLPSVARATNIIINTGLVLYETLSRDNNIYSQIIRTCK